MEASFKKSYASLGADRLVLLWLGVDCIAQYAVRLNGGRGPSGLRLD